MIKIDNLTSSLETLKIGFASFEKYRDSDFSDMLADSCVKRFEYTLETAIKLIKKFLKQIYSIAEKDLTVNNTFRLMEGYGFINSWEKWKDYYAKRNDTSHEYNLQKSRELLEIIPSFIVDVDYLVSNLSKELSKSE